MHAEAVKNIKYLGNLNVMDIEVNHPSHIYYGNGIAISNSHSYSYSYTSYYQAYQKYFFPTEFYTAALTYSDEKIDPKQEIAELVQDARLHDVQVLPPDIARKNVDFEIVKYKVILFGLSHIRNVGGSAIKSLSKLDLETFDKFIRSCKKIKRNVAESLIKSGACEKYKLQRNYMLNVLYMIMGRSDMDEGGSILHYKGLTPNEYKCFMDNIALGYSAALQKIIDEKACIGKRIPVIEAKIQHLNQEFVDTNRQKSLWEKIYLGVSLTCSAADDVEKINEDVISCKDTYRLQINKTKHKKGTDVCLHVVVDKIDTRQTSEKAKNPGQDYCYLNVSDNTASIKFVVCWPEIYEKFKENLHENAVVCIKGYKTSWQSKDQIVVTDIEFIG